MISQPTVSALSRKALLGTGLGLAIGIFCYLTLGASLGLCLGAVAFLAILVPFLTSWIASGMLTLCLALLVAFVTGGLSSGLVVIAFAAALSGLTHFLRRIGVSAAAGAAITLFLAMTWLSWPVWLAPWLHGGSQGLVAWLVDLHPAFAINGATQATFTVPWSHQRIAYQIMNLGQDVPYRLPASIWPSVALHGLIGLLLGGLAWRRATSSVPSSPPATGKATGPVAA